MLILPQGRAAQAESVGLQHASLVSAQVFAPLVADGEATALRELQGEILRGLAVRAHQPAAVHVPEATVHACRFENTHTHTLRVEQHITGRMDMCERREQKGSNPSTPPDL